MPDIRPENGRELELAGFACLPTYGGVLEGAPSEKMNARIIEDSPRYVRKLWGERATFIVEPKIGRDRENRPLLPRYECYALLWSYNTLTLYPLGTQLAVVFYCDDLNRPLFEIIADAIQDIPWEAHAVPYDI